MSILVSPPLDPSSSTSSSSSSLASLPLQKERRIRFAPLPVPPCDDVEDEEDYIQEDNAELEQIREDDENTLDNGKPAYNSKCIDTASLDDSKYAYYDESQRSASPCYRSKPTTQQLLSHSPVAHPPTWSAPKLVNLFRPFPFTRRTSPPTSTHSLTPTISIDSATTPTNASRASFNSKRRKSISAEEILTLGAINLFRPSSKHGRDGADSRRNSGSSWASSLWSGGSSSNLHSSRSSSPTFPRTASMQSTQSNMSSKSKLGSAITTTTKPRSSSVSSNTSTSSVPPTSRPSTKTPRRPKSADAAAPSKRGIRMLNGRVYGSKRQRGDVNHFANIKDEEPSFVEWGYGGMGSVKGGKHAGVANHWERLHGTAATTTAAGDKAADDDDDGTGMAWVKRRKEQREREKAEKEAKEKAEAEAAKAAESKPADVVTPEITEEPREAHTSTEPAPAPEPSTSAPVEKEVPAPSTPLQQPSSSSPASSGTAFPSPSGPSTPQLEHNLQAISIPASHNRRHKHGRSISRTSSLDVSNSGHVPLSSSPVATAVPAPSPLSQLPVKEKPIESESEEEESDSELNRQGDDEDEEDDDEEEEMNRQALCAGVEKISRHHENN